MSLPVRAAFWFAVCNVMLKGIQFITVPIFTSLMADEEYGRLSVFLTYEQMLYILATWEIQMGAYQKGIFKFKEEAYDFTAAAQFLINILTVICFAFAAVFHSWITGVCHNGNVYFFPAAAFVSMLAGSKEDFVCV